VPPDRELVQGEGEEPAVTELVDVLDLEKVTFCVSEGEEGEDERRVSDGTRMIRTRSRVPCTVPWRTLMLC
jgi:hypothetical protein